MTTEEKASLKQFYAPAKTFNLPHTARIPAMLKAAAKAGTGREVTVKAYVHAVTPSSDKIYLVPPYIYKKKPSAIGPGKLKS